MGSPDAYRAQPKASLSWARSRDIRDNLRYTLDVTDPYLGVVSRHSQLLSDMRYVRNHIAHKNSRTRVNFRKVVRHHYGGLKRGVTPGLLLITEAFGAPVLLERYVVSSRVLVRELVRA